MPVYVTGDLKGLLGTTLSAIQNDVQNLDRYVAKDSEEKGIWKSYQDSIRGRGTSFEIRMKDGKWLHMTVSGDQEKRYSLLSFVEVTDIHSTIKRYDMLLRKAEEESQSKTTFLNRMSHEIRTPMNGIMGMLTLAEDSLDTASPARTYLSKAGELSDHLLALINDILTVSDGCLWM